MRLPKFRGLDTQSPAAQLTEPPQFQDSGTLRRGGVRRWTSLKQHPRSEPLTETSTTTPISTPSSTANTSPLPHVASSVTGTETARKSNWQVIEHFSSKDKGSLSSSLIAVSGVLAIDDMPKIENRSSFSASIFTLRERSLLDQQNFNSLTLGLISNFSSSSHHFLNFRFSENAYISWIR